MEQLKQCEGKAIAYLDEVRNNNNITVQYGWSAIGGRSFAEQLGFPTEKLNIVAGYLYNTKEIVAPFEYHGATDLQLFEGWFEQQLCPSLEPGTLVILDNASFHKSDNIDHIAEEYGIELLYLPPYSPDLNPIEKFWANFKINLRKCIKEFRKFQDVITYTLNQTLSV